MFNTSTALFKFVEEAPANKNICIKAYNTYEKYELVEYRNGTIINSAQYYLPSLGYSEVIDVPSSGAPVVETPIVETQFIQKGPEEEIVIGVISPDENIQQINTAISESYTYDIPDIVGKKPFYILFTVNNTNFYKISAEDNSVPLKIYEVIGSGNRNMQDGNLSNDNIKAINYITGFDFSDKDYLIVQLFKGKNYYIRVPQISPTIKTKIIFKNEHRSNINLLGNSTVNILNNLNSPGLSYYTRLSPDINKHISYEFTVPGTFNNKDTSNVRLYTSDNQGLGNLYRVTESHQGYSLSPIKNNFNVLNNTESVNLLKGVTYILNIKVTQVNNYNIRLNINITN